MTQVNPFSPNQASQELLMSRGVVRMGLVGVLLSVCVGTGQGQPQGKGAKNKLPKELLGKWVVVEGPQKGATFEFFPDGKMIAKLNVNGNEAIINATVRVENKKLLSTTKNPQTGKEDTRVLQIREMTAKAFDVEAGQGELFKMRRPAEPAKTP
jgi:uncharacterized protein (TIGR03066 family)